MGWIPEMWMCGEYDLHATEDAARNCTGHAVERLKEKLREAETPAERIALYNDPANGTIAERAIAATEYDR